MTNTFLMYGCLLEKAQWVTPSCLCQAALSRGSSLILAAQRADSPDSRDSAVVSEYPISLSLDVKEQAPENQSMPVITGTMKTKEATRVTGLRFRLGT